MKRLGIVAIFCGSVAMGQVIFDPSSSSIGNAASGRPEIAPGSLIEVRDYALSGTLIRVVLGDQPLGSTQLKIVDRPSETTLRALVPADAPLGPSSISLVVGRQVVKSATIEIRAHAPGIFTKDGEGPALARNSLTNAAIAGDLVELWGTGLGEGGTVTVEIGGETVPAQYAGHHPDYPGLDQVNFYIPEHPFLGCYVPVTILVDGVRSNTATLAIGDARAACPHPLGLTYDELVTLDRGGSITAGSVNFNTNSIFGLTDGIDAWAGALFLKKDARDVFALARPQQPDSAYLRCERAGGAARLSGVFLFGLLDAGEALTLTGPDGTSLVSGEKPAYAWDLPLQAGSWLISGPGGEDIGAFQQSFTLPPALRLHNRDELKTISTDKDTVIAWDPSGYAPGDILTATLYRGNASLVCRTHAWSGHIVLPHEMLPPPDVSPFVDTLRVAVGPHPVSRTVFRVPLTGGGTAPVVVEYSIGDEIAEAYR